MINLAFLKNKYNIRPTNICYIGSNEGQELPEMLELFPNSKFYCFEPQVKPFKKLVKGYQHLNNVYFYNFALGSENTTKKMYINNNNNNMSSSIYKPKEHLDYHPSVTFDGFEDIVIKQFSDLKIQNVNFLNIDTQGYELEVLKGFHNLDEIKYIKTEVNRKELYENSPNIKDLDKYLKNYNFIRAETIWWKKFIPWGDAFYIKKNEISFIVKFKITTTNKIQNLKGYFWIMSKLKKF
tara:strand:+ start:624 stop:1337 length:714 start_codon:yes stop_codon:yes gene_type:complete